MTFLLLYFPFILFDMLYLNSYVMMIYRKPHLYPHKVGVKRTYYPLQNPLMEFR